MPASQAVGHDLSTNRKLRLLTAPFKGELTVGEEAQLAQLLGQLLQRRVVQGVGHVVEQEHLPGPLLGKRFYRASDQGREAEMAKRLEKRGQKSEPREDLASDSLEITDPRPG